MNEEQVKIIKLHKRWADGYTIIWQFIVIAVLAGIYFLLEQFNAGAEDRSNAVVLVAAVVVVSAVWQAAGLCVARMHMIVRGIDLNRNAPSAEKS